MKWLKSCVAAFRFLTVIPLPGTFGCSAEALEDSPLFFPFVGFILGLVAAASALLLWMFLPPLAAAVSLVIVLFSFSGALHLDGLADMADGFFSAREREKILVIMRDSRIGVMGVVAVVSVLLLKVAGLSACNGSQAAKTAFLMVLAGRCALVAMMALLPYVRPDGGLGTRFYAHRQIRAALLGMLVFLFFGAALYGTRGMALALIVSAAVMLFSFFSYRKIGGATGDTFGSVCEISEAIVAVFSIIKL